MFPVRKNLETLFHPPSPITRDSRIQAPKNGLMCIIGTVDEGLPPSTSYWGCWIQTYLPKGLYTFGAFGKFGNLMYLATRYMWKLVKLV